MVAQKIYSGIREGVSFQRELREDQRTRCKLTADLFDEIGENLTTFVSMWRENAPTGLEDAKDKLRELSSKVRIFGAKLPESLADVINEEEAKKLSEELKVAHEWKNYLIQNNPDDVESKLEFLSNAAGEFKATANLLRAR